MSAPTTIKIGRNTIVNTTTAYMSHGLVNLTSVAAGKIYEDDLQRGHALHDQRPGRDDGAGVVRPSAAPPRTRNSGSISTV